MVKKFLLQKEEQFMEALERIKATQEIEDSSVIITFQTFEETIKILFRLKLNFDSFEKFFSINQDKISIHL